MLFLMFFFLAQSLKQHSFNNSPRQSHLNRAVSNISSNIRSIFYNNFQKYIQSKLRGLIIEKDNSSNCTSSNADGVAKRATSSHFVHTPKKNPPLWPTGVSVPDVMGVFQNGRSIAQFFVSEEFSLSFGAMSRQKKKLI